jgi:hypothetical protein
MGNLVTLTLYMDEIDEVQSHPEDFAEAVFHSAISGGKSSDNLPSRFGYQGSFIMQKVVHSSVDVLYFQSGNTTVEIGTYSNDVERMLESNIDILEKDINIIQGVITRIKKRIKEKRKYL